MKGCHRKGGVIERRVMKGGGFTIQEAYLRDLSSKSKAY